VALVKPVIFQIAGFQNSGKTTFTKNLLKKLKQHEIRTVSIKHHGHGGKPDVDIKKDSVQHIFSGADVSIVEGEGRLLLQAEYAEFSLVDQLSLLAFFQPDVILIEGYKRENYPKVLLLRDESDLPLLDQVKNVIALVYWKEELKELINQKWDGHSYLISDDGAVDCVIRYILEEVHKMDEKN
jgi:molybdopterin-guanine dinucleotide biosynthesis adapter protein